MLIDWTEVLGPLPANESEAPAESAIAVGPEPVAQEEPDVAEVAALVPPESSFVSIASVALSLPVVAEALRQNGAEAEDEPVAAAESEPAEPGPSEPVLAAPEPVASFAEVTMLQPPPAEAASGMFQIAELVARIDAYQRQREESPATPIGVPSEIQPELFELDPVHSQNFRFETDASGTVRWIEGAARAPLIGLSLDLAALPSGSQVDGVAAGAFRRRAGFVNARLVVDGTSDAAGQWRITGIPVFDRESGRFTGYRGSARRPRPDESAEPVQGGRSPASDALRQLVHELRTPTNAIAGFAEMIETQMLGPVPQAYRVHAAAIRNQAGDLLTAIDDIDMAARIDSNALDLRATDVPLQPLLKRIAADLGPLAALRGALIDIYVGDRDIAVAGDDRAVERLIARLMATLVSSGGRGERIGVAATLDVDGMIALVFDRPQALAAYAGDALLTIDAEAEADRDGAPLLGTGFALRLVRNLAVELRGSLVIGDNALTLRLPAAVIDSVEQVSSS
jgi:signal transduction histidine kinase